MPDLSKLAFFSGVNYLKRGTDDLCGSTPLTLPAYGSTVSTTINHNLGYIPFFQVFTDITNDGTIWAAQKLDQYTDTSLTGTDLSFPTLISYITTTALVISLYNGTSPVASGTRTIYWLIYEDYES